MKLLYKSVALSIASLLFLEPTIFAAMTLEAKCNNDKGKMSKCMVENQDGSLVISFKDKKKISLNRKIPGEKIQRITGGEFAKRRVGTAVALGILVAPLALFTLFSKKKIENFGIEYFNENDKPDSILIQTGKKESYGMKTLLQSVSAKEVEYPEKEDTKGKKAGKSPETQTTPKS